MNNKTDNQVPDSRELENRMELLKKDFKLMEANVDGTLKDLRTDMERNNTEAVKRETRLILVILGAVGIGVAILCFVLN